MYTDWADAQKQIDGVKGPKYKKFATREEAQAFVDNGALAEKVLKKQKVETKAKGKGKGEKVEKEVRPKEEIKADTVRVWTDGSSRGNGRHGAMAGVGVWFGANDERFALPILFRLLKHLIDPLMN